MDSESVSCSSNEKGFVRSYASQISFRYALQSLALDENVRQGVGSHDLAKQIEELICVR